MNYIVTGTRAYDIGGDDESSSHLDIVLYPDNAHDLERWLSNKGIKVWRTEEQQSVDYSGFYFDLMGIQVNIIEAKNSEEIRFWKERTELMRTIHPIEDREERIRIFNDTDNFNQNLENIC